MLLGTFMIHEVKILILELAAAWKKLILTFMDNLRGFKTSVEEETEDMVETSRKLELELEWIAEITWWNLDEELLLIDEQRKCFLERESIPGETDEKFAGMTNGSSILHKTKVDKAVAGFEGIDSNYERSSAVGKMISKALHATEKLSMKES